MQHAARISEDDQIAMVLRMQQMEYQNQER